MTLTFICPRCGTLLKKLGECHKCGWEDENKYKELICQL